MLKLNIPVNNELALPTSRAELRAEADRDLAHRSLTGVLSYFLLWLIIYYASELEQANDTLLEFLGFLLAAAGVGRLYLALNFNKLYSVRPRLWRALFATGAIASAAVWGGVAALAMNYDGLGITSVMVMLPTAGIAAGGIVSLAPAPWVGGVFLVTILLPSIVVALLSGNVAERGVSLLFITFVAVMMALWWRLHVEYWRALVGRKELVIAKEVAEEATLAKGQFIASVSHELRTPLTAIIGSLGMIEEYPPEGMPEQAMTLVSMAYRNGKRLSLLINDILDFEKLNANRMEFNSKSIALTPFMEQAIELNQSYAESRQVTFELLESPDDAVVFADENRLMQVMTNLLSNAAKHSPAGDKVLIAARLGEGKVRVAVTDHGAGVPENFKGHIFEKFAQAENSSTKKANGTGLGLAISKAIIEKMGGTIGFDSVAGQGATFYFELPHDEYHAHAGTPG